MQDAVLSLYDVRTLRTRTEIAELLACRAPWVLGPDFPFGLPAEFVAEQEWSPEWTHYAARATSEVYATFRSRIEMFRASRPDGWKQPGRRVDRLARSESPLTTVRTPVAAMFHAGTPLLLRAPCDVLPFGKSERAAVVVEAYPALIARHLIAGNRYKDGDAAQTREVRDTLLRRVVKGDLSDAFGFR